LQRHLGKHGGVDHANISCHYVVDIKHILFLFIVRKNLGWYAGLFYSELIKTSLIFRAQSISVFAGKLKQNSKKNKRLFKTREMRGCGKSGRLGATSQAKPSWKPVEAYPETQETSCMKEDLFRFS
jgi:hypothetical protein